MCDVYVYKKLKKTRRELKETRLELKALRLQVAQLVQQHDDRAAATQLKANIEGRGAALQSALTSANSPAG